MKMSGMFSRKTYLACALAMLPVMSAVAEVQGEVQTLTGAPYVYNVPLGTSDITADINQGLGEVSREFALGEIYLAKAFCPQGNITTMSPIFYTSTASLQVSTENPGYLSLNEYLDAKIEIYIDGNVKEYFPVPFTAKTNKYNINTCANGSQQLIVDFKSGGQGRVTFKVKKPIINGINITGQEVAQLYGSLVEGTIGSVPMAVINILSAIITVPDKCVINEGTPITVDFQTIGGRSADLDGVNHAQNVPVKIQCEGGSFSTTNFDVKFGIQPGTGISSFNSDYLATTGTVDRSNLAISIKDDSGNTIKPNTFYDVPGFGNNQGVWNLVVAPVANPASTAIPEGDFQSSATIIAQFP